MADTHMKMTAENEGEGQRGRGGRRTVGGCEGRGEGGRKEETMKKTWRQRARGRFNREKTSDGNKGAALGIGHNFGTT